MSTSSGYFPMWGNTKSTDRDVESGLYPGIGETEQMLRLGCVMCFLGSTSVYGSY